MSDEETTAGPAYDEHIAPLTTSASTMPIEPSEVLVEEGVIGNSNEDDALATRLQHKQERARIRQARDEKSRKKLELMAQLKKLNEEEAEEAEEKKSASVAKKTTEKEKPSAPAPATLNTAFGSLPRVSLSKKKKLKQAAEDEEKKTQKKSTNTKKSSTKDDVSIDLDNALSDEEEEEQQQDEEEEEEYDDDFVTDAHDETYRHLVRKTADEEEASSAAFPSAGSDDEDEDEDEDESVISDAPSDDDDDELMAKACVLNGKSPDAYKRLQRKKEKKHTESPVADKATKESEVAHPPSQQQQQPVENDVMKQLLEQMQQMQSRLMTLEEEKQRGVKRSRKDKNGDAASSSSSDEHAPAHKRPHVETTPVASKKRSRVSTEHSGEKKPAAKKHRGGETPASTATAPVLPLVSDASVAAATQAACNLSLDAIKEILKRNYNLTVVPLREANEPARSHHAAPVTLPEVAAAKDDDKVATKKEKKKEKKEKKEKKKKVVAEDEEKQKKPARQHVPHFVREKPALVGLAKVLVDPKLGIIATLDLGKSHAFLKLAAKRVVPLISRNKKVARLYEELLPLTEAGADLNAYMQDATDEVWQTGRVFDHLVFAWTRTAGGRRVTDKPCLDTTMSVDVHPFMAGMAAFMPTETTFAQMKRDSRRRKGSFYPTSVIHSVLNGQLYESTLYARLGILYAFAYIHRGARFHELRNATVPYDSLHALAEAVCERNNDDDGDASSEVSLPERAADVDINVGAKKKTKNKKEDASKKKAKAAAPEKSASAKKATAPASATPPKGPLPLIPSSSSSEVSPAGDESSDLLSS